MNKHTYLVILTYDSTFFISRTCPVARTSKQPNWIIRAKSGLGCVSRTRSSTPHFGLELSICCGDKICNFVSTWGNGVIKVLLRSVGSFIRHLLLFTIKNPRRRDSSCHVVNVERVQSRSTVWPELEHEAVERAWVTVKGFQHGHLSTSCEVFIQTHRVGWPLKQTRDKIYLPYHWQLESRL